MFAAVIEVFGRCFGSKGTLVVAFASQETAVLRWLLSETRKFDIKEIDKRQTTPVIRLRSTRFERCAFVRANDVRKIHFHFRALHSCFFFLLLSNSSHYGYLLINNVVSSLTNVKRTSGKDFWNLSLKLPNQDTINTAMLKHRMIKEYRWRTAEAGLVKKERRNAMRYVKQPSNELGTCIVLYSKMCLSQKSPLLQP